MTYLNWSDKKKKYIYIQDKYCRHWPHCVQALKNKHEEIISVLDNEILHNCTSVHILHYLFMSKFSARKYCTMNIFDSWHRGSWVWFILTKLHLTDLTWPQLGSHDITWHHLPSPEITWHCLTTPNLVWSAQISHELPDLIYCTVTTPDLTYLTSFDLKWPHQTSPDLCWSNTDLTTSTKFLILLGLNFPNTVNTGVSSCILS
jgi:hypothetical protein